MQMMTWHGFLRKQRRNPTARVLLAMGGAHSHAMEDRLRQRLRAGRIDKESFELRLAELLRLRGEFNHKRPVAGDLHDLTEWVELGNGGWRKKVFKGVS